MKRTFITLAAMFFVVFLAWVAGYDFDERGGKALGVAMAVAVAGAYANICAYISGD